MTKIEEIIAKFGFKGMPPIVVGTTDQESRLTSFYETAIYNLDGLREAITKVGKTDYSKFKDEEIGGIKSETIKNARKRLFDYIKALGEAAQNEVEKARGAVLAVTAVHPPTSNEQAILLELRRGELRRQLEKMEPEERLRFVSEAMDQKDLEPLHAVMSGPGRKLLSEETIKDLREDYGLKNAPELADELGEALRWDEFTHRRRGQLNMMATVMISEAEINDPLSWREFVEGFPPRDDADARAKNRKLQEEEKQQLYAEAKQQQG